MRYLAIWLNSSQAIETHATIAYDVLPSWMIVAIGLDHNSTPTPDNHSPIELSRVTHMVSLATLGILPESQNLAVLSDSYKGLATRSAPDVRARQVQCALTQYVVSRA